MGGDLLAQTQFINRMLVSLILAVAFKAVGPTSPWPVGALRLRSHLDDLTLIPWADPRMR